MIPTRFVVSNLAHLTAEQVYDELYVQRGDAENRIKEQQLGLFADRTSCSKFLRISTACCWRRRRTC